MADRGEYRAIPRVLLDGKDFQRLSERARWVFCALKLNIGPSGIEVHYPEAIVHQLAAQTGAPPDGVRAALEELERGGWIRREANVLWIVKQLKYDPHMTVTDQKHRKAIWRHVAGLPRLAIVRAFVDEYAAWFDDCPEDPRKDLPRALQGPTQALRSTDDREPMTENLKPTDATHPAGAAVENSAGGEQATDPPEQPAPDEPSDADMYALLAPLIRQHVWLGKGPPDDAPKGWGMGRDLSICRQLMRKGGFSPTDFAGGLSMCRDPAAGDIVPPRKPITMAYFNRAGRMDLIQQLVHAYRKKSDWGPVNVGRILRAAS